MKSYAGRTSASTATAGGISTSPAIAKERSSSHPTAGN